MVSGLTPPSKRDNDDKRDANIESLRDSVRFSAPTTNVLNTMGSKVGGGGSQIVPSIQGLFATNPSEIPESIELTYTESTTTSPLKTGDEVTSSINGWKGKLIRVTNTNVNNNINRKEALFSNTSTVTFSNASQNIVKTGWSAAYLINTQTENALVLSSSAPIVSTSLTGGNPIIKQIYGTTNNGQILFMKPKDGKTLTLKASTGVYPNVVGNIDMSADVTVNDDSFVILQYFADVNNTANDVTGRYLLLSGGGSSTGMNNPATAQLDMAAFSIKGAWGGTTDTLGIQSDLDMTTYDIIDLDRLKFSTIAGSGTALTSSNTGIEALYNAGNPFGMLIQFPNTNSAVMQIKRGTVDMINISSLGVLLGDELLMGGHKISNVATPTASSAGTDVATKAYVLANGGIGLNDNNIWTGTNEFQNTVTVKDSSFGIRDGSDSTKVASFECSGITSGNTRTYTLPNSSTTLASLGISTQSFTGKNLYINSTTWQSYWDTDNEKQTNCQVKFQGDGQAHTGYSDEASQRVMEIGKYGTHEVKINAEITGSTGRTMTNPDGGSDIPVPGTNEPALAIKAAMIMNTYTMYDLDT